ncbi:hypothetical protein [Xanthomonas campestris]|uniref:hypothetical protein n=1 Tax=Xanthomonas campestris TaxID=339 RepID=UPI0023791703|nr:hypothetical protein [Xanthomonas campestris]WDL54321.1 hypothetical protein JH263_20890 [Xanthomonas campestris pv. campestris]
MLYKTRFQMDAWANDLWNLRLAVVLLVALSACAAPGQGTKAKKNQKIGDDIVRSIEAYRVAGKTGSGSLLEVRVPYKREKIGHEKLLGQPEPVPRSNVVTNPFAVRHLCSSVNY